MNDFLPDSEGTVKIKLKTFLIKINFFISFSVFDFYYFFFFVLCFRSLKLNFDQRKQNFIQLSEI